MLKADLPIQKLDEQYAGHMRLWYHVLWQALEDLTVPSLRSSTLYWVNSDEYRTGSFLWLADQLGFDPTRMRLAVGNRDALKLAKQRLKSQRKSREKSASDPIGTPLS